MQTYGEALYHIKMRFLIIGLTGYTGAGQSLIITGNVDSTDVVTVAPAWTLAPDATTDYEIICVTVNTATVLGETPMTTANVNTQVDTALSDINLDHLLAVSAGSLDADLSLVIVDESVMAHAMSDNAVIDDYDASTDSLEQLAADVAGVPTTTDFELRTLPTASYVVVGDTIAGVTLCTTTTTNSDMVTAATLEAECVDALESFQLDHLAGVTTTVAADGDLSAYVVDGSILSHLMSTGATVETSSYDASTDSLQAIAVDTTEIGAAGAGLTAVVWNSDWDTEVQSDVNDELVLQNLDHLCKVTTTVAADADLSAYVVDGTILSHIMSVGAAIETDSYDASTDSLQALRVRGDAAWTTGSGTGLTSIDTGTCQTAECTAASSITLAEVDQYANGILTGNMIVLTGGTGAGQSRIITGNTAADDVATIAPNWITNPDDTTTYEIIGGTVNIGAIDSGVSITSSSSGGRL